MPAPAIEQAPAPVASETQTIERLANHAGTAAQGGVLVVAEVLQDDRIDGGSGFITCFVAGITFGAQAKKHKQGGLESAESSGDALALLTWFTLGTILLVPAYMNLTWRVVVYAVASLTVIRMLPVFLNVIGCGLRTDTKLLF